MASMKSSEASPSMSQPYQVFLSFRGPDTRYSFTDFLYTKLEEIRYKVFRDKEGIANGQTIGSTLQVAIQESKVSVVVLSADYASSKWCLDELVTIMNRHEKEGHKVLPVFYHVEPSDVRNQRGSYAKSFVQHEELYREDMERVEGWRAALRKIGKLKGEHIKEERYWTEVIQTIVNDIGGIIGNGLETTKYAFPVTDLVGKGFERAWENLWSLLMEDEVVRIGVYGMAGVGKTTLMKHIRNQLLETSQQFPHVYWITASQDCDEDKLQNLICKSIGLDLSNEVDGMHRAAKLSHELAENGNFVLIIDDIWKHFDLEQVGLPLKQNRCKLIFTTRSLEVCWQMDCQNNVIKIEPLSPEEAWVLFEREHGAYNIKVEQLAKEIVSECAGLPLAIKTIGRSMKGAKDEFVWRNAVDKIKDPKIRRSHMDPVFQVLRFSYSRLNDSSLQQCLLYCALFPEDFGIGREELIEYLIDEGIVERRKCRREEVDEGRDMVRNLVNLCLLEEDYHFLESYDFIRRDFGYHVKMHDLIRDMALKILSEESSVMVEVGKQLIECPDADEWEQTLVRVSLLWNNIREIGSDHSPICPNLSTLLLSHNIRLQMISDSFFEKFDGLKVLDLSRTSIRRLPESVSNLVRLSVLLLRNCFALLYMPSLAKLIVLQKLDLVGCRTIKEVPHGMESLHKLRYLDLGGCSKLKEFPAGILPNLFRLQVLRIRQRLTLKGQEVGCLKKLEELECGFPNPVEFNRYLRLAKPLRKFQIYVNPSYDIHVLQNVKEKESKYLYLGNSDLRKGGDFPKLPKGIEELVFRSCRISEGSLGDTFELNDANELKSINIFSCNGVECLASMSGLSANVFPTLEVIYLSDLSNLRCLISNENENGVPLALPSTQTFACLKLIRITRCHSIKKLFPRGLLGNLQNLDIILVEECDGVMEIVATDDKEDSSNSLSDSVTLPNLLELRLVGLPLLESIYCGKLICESLQTIHLDRCPMLKRIPISLPLPSLCEIEVDPREWWEQVEWDHPDAKQILQHLVKYIS